MSHCHRTITPSYKNYFTSDRLISNSGSGASFGMIYELFCTFNIVPYEDLDVEFFEKVLMDSVSRKKKKNNLLAHHQSFPNPVSPKSDAYSKLMFSN
jgi:hypothetical protein